MWKFFSKMKKAINHETMNIDSGIGRSVSHVYARHFNWVVVDGIRLEVSDGVIRLYTDDKPYKIVVDGEIIRR